MHYDERRFNVITEHLKICMLPSLNENLDEVELHLEQFRSYHSLLHSQLPKLYDVLQNTEDIFSNKYLHQSLRAQLILLLCELTAKSTIYSLDSGILRNAKQLMEKLEPICGQAEKDEIFGYYEQKLQKDNWKRQLGAVHGFVRYLEYYYLDDTKMSQSLLRFSLSVALKVRECYQAEYKQLGVRIFSRILSQGHGTDIKQMNVQGVIYENVFRDAHAMDSVEATESIWNCLFQCMDHFSDLNGFSWTQCDDMLERLIQNVSLTSSTQVSVCLLHFITRMGYYHTINRSEIFAALSTDFSQPEKLTACRKVCVSLNVSMNYRWVKDILQMLVLQSEKLLKCIDAAAKMIPAMQRCYLVFIYPIPIRVCEVHLENFLNKFVSSLLTCLAVHDKEESLVQLTKEFLGIFACHLKRTRPDNESVVNFNHISNALHKLNQQHLEV